MSSNCAIKRNLGDVQQSYGDCEGLVAVLPRAVGPVVLVNESSGGVFDVEEDESLCFLPRPDVAWQLDGFV